MSTNGSQRNREGITEIKKIGIVLITAALVFNGLLPSAHARRSGGFSKEVAVTYKGVEFKSHFYQNAGVVEAFDIATGKKIWERKVYDMTFDSSRGIGWDDQLVFITSLKINSKDELLVTNDQGKEYVIPIPKEILKIQEAVEIKQ